MFGRTVHDKILKKITDPRVTTVEQIKELTDFKYPMSLENYNILTTTEDGYLIKRGEDKLTNKQWKKKYFSQLNSEIGRKKQSEREFSQEEIKNYIRYQYDEEDEKPRKERKKLGNDISKWL